MISHDVTSLSEGNDAVAAATLRVNVIADLVCPWSYVGKRRLEKALAAVRGPSIVNWTPFQLNPDMPLAGMGMEEYLSSRFGTVDAIRPGLDELTRVGAGEGVNFRFDRVSRVPNTLNAHRMVMYAESQGVATTEITESLMKGFFTDGLDISDRDVLLGVGRSHALEQKDLIRMLDDDESLNRVRASEARVRRSGVTGVPDFLVNDRLFVVGAQPSDALVDVFDRAMFGAESDLPLEGSVH
ncbi:MAG: DsbA family oxidoreductase [Woeseiaceae bacterium]|nr:DsbA family oxidoreductase [Woeseiaceae bacterium]